MKHEKVIEILSAMCDNLAVIAIVDVINLTDDAELILFSYDGVITAAINYHSSDELLFTLTDWQQGCYPTTFDEIESFTWMTQYEQDAILLGGLPRVL